MRQQRKLYSELIRKSIRQGRLLWLSRQAFKYFGVLASSVANKPLCGPLVGSILVTYRCNANCMMCDLPNRGCKKSEFSAAQIKQIIDAFHDLGVSSIGFTGGEPFLREDIFELIKYAKSKGLSTQLSTNGFLLNTDIIDSIFESGLDSINISIDTSSPETHEQIRGVKSGFRKAVEGIRQLTDFRKREKKDLLITTSGIVSNDNLDSYLDLVKLISSLEADCLVVEALETDGEIIPPHRLDKLDQLVDQLVDLKSQTGIIENSAAYLNMLKEIYRGSRKSTICYSPYAFCAVDCYGNVFPCWNWIQQNKSVGNIQDSSLQALWKSEKYGKIRKSLKHCSQCSFHCHLEMNLLYKKFNVLNRD